MAGTLKRISYCGLICDSCPIYLATREPDPLVQQKMRQSIAEQCRSLYGMSIQPEDVADCDGCRSETGRIFPGCLNCEIRKCAASLHIENCAFCSNYACDKLSEIFSMEPEAQNRLDEINRRLANPYSPAN